MMLPFACGRGAGDEISVLAIGAHSDDIEIGCGATTLRLIERYPNLTICWVVLSAHGERVGEAARSAEAFLAGLEHHRLILRDFKDGFFPYCVDMLLEHFGSQRSKHWFTADLFYSLMRLRGMEAHAPSRYAEAFCCRKSVLQIAGPSAAAIPRRAFPSR